MTINNSFVHTSETGNRFIMIGEKKIHLRANDYAYDEPNSFRQWFYSVDHDEFEEVESKTYYGLNDAFFVYNGNVVAYVNRDAGIVVKDNDDVFSMGLNVKEWRIDKLTEVAEQLFTIGAMDCFRLKPSQYLKNAFWVLEYKDGKVKGGSLRAFYQDYNSPLITPPYVTFTLDGGIHYRLGSKGKDWIYPLPMEAFFIYSESITAPLAMSDDEMLEKGVVITIQI